MRPPENEPHFYDGAARGPPRIRQIEAPAQARRHRYYRSTEHFGGPGSPILLVVGGEGALNNGMLYPYVTHDLARRLSAAVVQPEHRFYGPYQPLGPDPTVEDRLDVFTPAQAMEDMLRLVLVHLRGPGQPFERCSPTGPRSIIVPSSPSAHRIPASSRPCSGCCTRTSSTWRTRPRHRSSCTRR